MKKYIIMSCLVLSSGLLFARVAPNATPTKSEVAAYLDKKREEYKARHHKAAHHHKATRAEKIRRGEKTVNQWSAVASAVNRTNLKTTNPEAYARVNRVLSRAQTRLSNLKSGTRTHYRHHNRHHEKADAMGTKNTRRTNGTQNTTPAKTAPGNRETLMQRLFGKNA